MRRMGVFRKCRIRSFVFLSVLVLNRLRIIARQLLSDKNIEKQLTQKQLRVWEYLKSVKEAYVNNAAQELEQS
jgi:hypothetical protein